MGGPGEGPAPPGLLPWQVLFLAGAAGAWGVHDPATAALAAGLILLVSLLCGWRSRLRLALIPACSLAGLAAAWLALPAVPDLPAWLDDRVRGQVSGLVRSVEEKPGGRLEIILEEAVFHPSKPEDGPSGLPLPGRLVWTWQDPAFRPAPGSRVRVQTRPHAAGGFANPGLTDWGWRWRLKGVFLRAYSQGDKGGLLLEAAPLSGLAAWRQSLSLAILRGAAGARPPEPGDQASFPALAGRALPSEAGMVLGLVTGERYAVDRQDLDRVRRASLSHLLAVSGMNLAAVAAMGWGLAWLAGLAWPGLFLRLPRPRLAVLLGAPLVLGYLWLGRFEPSLTRAAVMFAAWGLLVLLGRPRVLLDGLFLALAVMFVWNPLSVFDVGLQLSAAAVAGLALLVPLAGPVFHRLLPRADAPGGRRPVWRWLLALPLGWLTVTLAAQLAVLPIQFGVFGEASPHLYLNLLWAPVVEWAAQPLAYLGALSVTWLPAVGQPLLQASAWVCGLMLASLKALDAAGWLTTYPVQRPWQPEALGYALLLGGLAWAWSMPRARRLAWLGLCAALLAAPPLYRAWDQSRDRVSLTVLDVGQSQAVLIEARGGRRWLVDAGGSQTGTFDLGRAVLAPVLTWGRPPALDGAIASHEDRDHTGGLAYLLRSFRLGFLAGNGALPAAGDFREALAASGLTPAVWKAPRRVELAPDLVLETLSPPEGTALRGNDASLVLRLVWRGRGLALLPGDAGSAVLEGLAASGAELSSEVLVVPHHGSANSLAPTFYRRVGPTYAAASCGRGNPFGFPAPTVVKALESAGARTLTTARSGALRFVWGDAGGGPATAAQRGHVGGVAGP